MPKIEIDSARSRACSVHVEDSGTTGRPVVLIHGWPLSAEAWRPQFPALTKAGFRPIAYDRVGFGRSDKPSDGYDYDSLATDLDDVLARLELFDVTLVGFSMGGGEVARYVPKFGRERLRSVVFAAAVPPYLMKGEDNPDGPLDPDEAAELRAGLQRDRRAFFEEFTTNFFSVDGELKVSEAERLDALRLCEQSGREAALGCMDAWARTDFRRDLPRIDVPALVLHGDGDGIVPFEGSGRRTHELLPDSRIALLDGAPHGCNTTHAPAFNDALIEFLERE